MAAYAKSMTLAQLKKQLEIWNNTQQETILLRVITLLNTEFAAAETAGLAGYTVTTGLQNSLEEYLKNFPNDLLRQHLKHLFTLLVTEFGLVETNGLAYTVTSNLKRHLYDTLACFELTHRMLLHKVLDYFMAEFDLMEAAS